MDPDGPAPSATTRPLPPHLVRGRRAEAVAARFLKDAGLVPVAVNFRCRWGELDLVMRDGPCLAVVEVRFLSRVTRAHPVETVDRAKCRRIIVATRIFLERYRRAAGGGLLPPVRFDVVGIAGEGAAAEITWVRNAFTADDVAAS